MAKTTTKAKSTSAPKSRTGGQKRSSGGGQKVTKMAMGDVARKPGYRDPYEMLASQARYRSSSFRMPNLPDRHTVIDDVPFSLDSEGLETIQDAVEKSYKCYFGLGLVRNFVDIMVDFGKEGIVLTHDKPTVRTFLETWQSFVKIEQFKEQFSLEFFRSSNVGAYKIMGKVRRSKFKGIVDSTVPGETVLIPIEYTILNPRTIVSVNPAFTRGREYAVKIPSGLARSIRRLIETKKDTVQFDSPIIRAVLAGKDVIPLDPQFFELITRGKQPYEPFGVPFLYSVFDDIAFKQELRAMDRETARTMISLFGLINVGDEDHVATPEDIRQVIQLLNMASSSHTLVTNHTVKVSWPTPPVENILGKEKYESVDQDIRYGMGFNEVLAGGQGGAYANTFLAIRVLVERINTCRERLAEYLQTEMNQLAKSMGFRVPPKVVLHKIGLRDENVHNRLFVRLGEIGHLPPETVFRALETGNLPENFGLIEEAWQRHKENMDKGLFVNPLQPKAMDDGKHDVTKEKIPSDKAPTTRKPGKQLGQPTGPQGNKRTPTPRPQGATGTTGTTGNIEKALEVWFKAHTETVGAFCGLANLSDESQLSPKQRQILASITRVLLITAIAPSDIDDFSARLIRVLHSPEELNGLEKRAGEVLQDVSAFWHILATTV